MAVLLLALFLDTLAIDWGLPYVHSWTSDDISPHHPLRVVRTWMHGHHKYPFFGWWLDFLLYSPWLSVWWLTGSYESPCQGDVTRCFTNPHVQLGTLMLLTRIMHACMGVGMALLTYEISLRVFADRRGAVFGALLASCSTVLVYRAHIGNLDLPAAFWMTFSLLFYVRILDEDRVLDHIGFGILAAFAVGTKEQVVGTYVGVGAMLYGAFVTRHARGSSTIRSFVRAHAAPRMAALILLPAFVYGLIQNVFFNWDGFVAHITHWLGASGSVALNEMPRYQGPLWLAGHFANDLGRSLGAPSLILCGLGLMGALASRPRRAAIVLVPLASYYLFSIQAIAHYTYPRLSLPMVPLLAVFGGWLFGALFRFGSWRRWLAWTAGGGAALYGFLGALNVDLAMLRDSRYAAESWLEEHVPKDRPIGVFSTVGYLPRLDYLGYEVTRYPEEAMTPRSFENAGPDYLVLTHRYFGRFETGEKKTFFDALLAGQLAYRVAWKEWQPAPLEPLLRRSYVPSSVNTRIYILARRPEDGAPAEPSPAAISEAP